MRGKAFGFVVLLCVTWTTARIMLNVTGQPSDPPHEHRKPSPARQWSRDEALPEAARDQYHISRYAIIFQAAAAPDEVKDRDSYGRAQPVGSDHQTANPQNIAPQRPLIVAQLDDKLSEGPLPPAALNLPTPHTHVPFDIYAYSFWRNGAVSRDRFGNGQYGGSQSAVSITIPVLRYHDAKETARLAVIGRFSKSHGKASQSEWAGGVQWHPVKSIPAQIFIERRVRQGRSDAVAAYLAGGHAGSTLPFAFKLDGYGQAGFISGKDGGAFVDAQLAAQRPLAGQGGSQLSAGGGIWGGGQSNIMRLDVGPSVHAWVPAGPVRLRIDASWRFRVAGDAQPGNGPTVTLSTSF